MGALSHCDGIAYLATNKGWKIYFVIVLQVAVTYKTYFDDIL